jgi:MinD-like ATPase involved in chromosome partitioning or flagellar assembly
MAYIAFASAKASPGVTTAVVSLATVWPSHRALYVVEADPSGGDLMARFELPAEPGLVTLAAAGRRGLTEETLLTHTQPFFSAGGIGGQVRRVLVAPVSADQTVAALAALRGGLPRTLSSLGADVLVDCGRLDPGSPAQEIAAASDLLVVVVRPVVTEVHHLASRLSVMRPNAVSVLLVGDHPYSVVEVAQSLGASPLGSLPSDDRAAAALTVGRVDGLKVLRRSRLLRDAQAVAEGLADWLGGEATAAPSLVTASRPGMPPEDDMRWNGSGDPLSLPPLPPLPSLSMVLEPSQAPSSPVPRPSPAPLPGFPPDLSAPVPPAHSAAAGPPPPVRLQPPSPPPRPGALPAPASPFLDWAGHPESPDLHRAWTWKVGMGSDDATPEHSDARVGEPPS